NLSAEHLPMLLDQAQFGEFKALHTCFNHLPSPAKVHLANSMAVRYANYIGLAKLNQEVICNRGTSGIDGSNSTAVGCTFTTKESVVLFTGDMAFFYVRNAFCHNYSLPNLRIFRLINGPASQPELEEYFETQQRLDASYLARENNFEYTKVSDEIALNEALKTFFQQSVKPKILEITSSSPQNAAILSKLKAAAKTLFGS